MIVDILDSGGNTIGQLELPDGTTQDVINAQLALYTYTVPAPTMQQRIQASIANASDFGGNLIIQFATENVLAGITQAGKTQNVANYVADLNYYLSTGSLYAAINEINSYIADTSDTKTGLSHFITNDILYRYLNYIQNYLELPLTANPGS